MLSNLQTFWPPRPGPREPQTGTKISDHTATTVDPIRENLTDLHEPAWWSGIRVTVSTHNHRIDRGQACVRLIKADGSPAFDLAPTECEWIQTYNTWTKFPWAIPAAMATTLDLRIEVTLLDVPNSPSFARLTACFHEMPFLRPRDRYLFVDSGGKILQQWNGRQHADGVPGRNNTPGRGDNPVWRTIHHVVPPSSMLQDWDDTTVFCVHDWDEIVPLDSAQ